MYPPVLGHVRVKDKKKAQNNPEVQARIKEVEEKLGYSKKLL